jgi:spore coat polysaccharide biosynthesis protein SpsF
MYTAERKKNWGQSTMKVVAIIQARMRSTRLPGKVMVDLVGQPMLIRVVNRAHRSQMLDEVIVATTVNQADDVIVEACARYGWPCFRGHENDVLDRYYQAAKAYRAEGIVRITSDCPLIEPEVIDRIVHTFLDKAPDYVSNTMTRTYPRGLDTEVMTLDALARAWLEATEAYQRVHVTPYIYRNPRLFRLISVTAEMDYSNHRWTVDTPEDLNFVREVYARFDNDAFSWRDVLRILTQEPELMEINRHIRQKCLQEG